jgi:hypothetical protein
MGFWFNKHIDSFTSPTVEAAAAASASAAGKLNENK